MELGKIFIIIGIAIVLVGILVSFVPGFGKFPGDILIKRENSTFYFPIVTSIILSIILTLLLNLFFRR